MATVVVRAIAGDVVLGPLYFEAPPCVSDIKSRLQECLELLPGQEVLLLQESAILSDTTKLRGGSAEDPVALNMVTSKQSLQALVWGLSTNGPQWPKVSEQLERGIVAVSSTRSAFAALTESGSVITWGEGEEEDGGDSDGVLGLDQGVLQVLGNKKAFVARKTGGELVVWGDANAGGKPNAEIRAQLRDGVVAMARTMQAFAAVKENGEVVVWGNPEFGGDSSSAGSLRGVVSVVGTWGETSGAFAALTDTGGVVTWGDAGCGGDLGSKSEQVAKDVKSICASGCSFAALKTTGEVVCWGDPERGGEPAVVFSHEDSGMAQYSVKEKLSRGVVSIVASDDVFMALKESGEVREVVGWGMGEDGAHLDENLVKELGNDVVSIAANVAAFAALKAGGRVVTWGPYTEKGLTQLESGVVNIPSFSWPSMLSFAALKDNGSLVVWSGVPTSLIEDTPHEELESGVVDVVGNPGSYVALKYAAAPTSDA
ncbi:ANKRD50 [Symbiodinium natans]|uniref:ANKRD50 protein n=1 Tax=Symbiodinium natans TaxID=878477 RepID=A0A812QVH4_9DINO|nr:ANKRD50 [Symbiodinium natans]